MDKQELQPSWNLFCETFSRWLENKDYAYWQTNRLLLLMLLITANTDEWEKSETIKTTLMFSRMEKQHLVSVWEFLIVAITALLPIRDTMDPKSRPQALSKQ